MIVLKTERLDLSLIEKDDAPFLIELLNDPSFIENIGDRQVRSKADALQYIENGPAASYARNGYGLYLVRLTEIGESLGMCGLIKRDYLEDVDIGYAYLPRYWRQGYAFEAASAVMGFASLELGLERMAAIVNPENIPSIRLLQKLGFHFEKMIRVPGQSRDIQMLTCPLQGYNRKNSDKGQS